MGCHTVVIDEGIVDEKLGGQHFSDTIRGVTYITQKWKGGSFNFFPVIQNNLPSPLEINNDRSLIYI
jgi:hypothetical protein